MNGSLSQLIRTVLFRVEALFNAVFGANNPFYHLGGLGFYFFYILLVTGIYLFCYYEPTVAGSYNQLQRLTREQWYLGGVIRSLHRYAADGMVLVMVLHILREWVSGRFRGVRWFSWITGVPAMVMVYLSGIVGFWMVWDERGQFIVVRTFEWLDWLPIFVTPLARNFLSNADVTDVVFRLLFIIHIGIALFLQAALLVHVKRVSRARILPPRSLALGTLAALLLLSIIQPAVSETRADLSSAVGSLPLDWFYMFLYPLMGSWSMGAVWMLVGAMIMLLLVLPWWPRSMSEPVAAVNLDYCTGCGFCADDCPYEAITMQERSDGNSVFLQEASIITGNCVSCGICTGACPSSDTFRHVTGLPLSRASTLKSGIEMPHRNVEMLRQRIERALDGTGGTDKILLVGCEHGVDIRTYATREVASLWLPCIGMLPPVFIEYALSKGAAGVLLAGCRKGDCYHRLGGDWLGSRLNDGRRPVLRRSVDRSRIGLCWVAPPDRRQLRESIDALRQSLRESPKR